MSSGRGRSPCDTGPRELRLDVICPGTLAAASRRNDGSGCARRQDFRPITRGQNAWTAANRRVPRVPVEDKPARSSERHSPRWRSGAAAPRSSSTSVSVPAPRSRTVGTSRVVACDSVPKWPPPGSHSGWPGRRQKRVRRTYWSTPCVASAMASRWLTRPSSRGCSDGTEHHHRSHRYRPGNAKSWPSSQRGGQNQAISKHLHVAARTVEAHVTQILLKLGVDDSADSNRRVLAVLTYLQQ